MAFLGKLVADPEPVTRDSVVSAYTTVLLMESAIGKTSWSVDPFNARLDSSVRPCGCAGRDQRVGTPTARLLRQRHAENE
jgi:hypothetical protein